MAHENPLQEIWRIREEMGAEEGYDVHRLFERLRREQERYAPRLVRVPPRGRPEESTGALREEPPKAG
jgi:hypothetical protein